MALLQFRLSPFEHTYRHASALATRREGTAPGDVVTNARGGESLHNFGVAFDIKLFDANGKYMTNGADPAYSRAGVIGESFGLEWGERWSNPDPSHFEYTQGGIPLSIIRERFEAGVDVFTGK